jgi:hypothetical protein
MLTKSDAVKVGKAIVDAFNKEVEMNLSSFDMPTARGIAYSALQNIWYDVLPVKVREQFGYQYDNFAVACFWK